MNFTNTYLNRVYQDVAKRYEHEPEFLQAVTEFFESIELIISTLPHFEEQGVLERLVEPERIIQFRVPWVDDENHVQVNRGYRVEFNSAIGPYKGGLRFDPSVNLSILKFLGFEQTFKNALTGLPLGGGKGGSDFTSKGKSDREIMRFCQSFMSELYRHLGPNTDVPAGDIGVGSKEIGYLFGYYRKLRNEFTGTITGKGLSYGGSMVRTEATGYGVCYFVQEILKNQAHDTFVGKRVIVSGCGNVGIYAAKKAIELGAIVVGMSKTNSCVIDEHGLDLDLITRLVQDKKDLMSYSDIYPHARVSSSNKELWKVPCDIALPCATQNELDVEDAKILIQNKVKIICEGANMPTTLEATALFIKNGILFAPGKAANAGGVATSGLEMSQNSIRESWTFEVVDEKLKAIMSRIYHACYEASVRVGQPGNLVLGANISGFLKVYDAMVHQGII